MTNAYWMQLGNHPVFAFEVNERMIGITYWLDAEAFEGVEPPPEAPPVPESGWYFVAVNQPRYPERVALGLELRRDMSDEELAQTVHQALEGVANEVLLEGGGD
ncbi:MAG: hypothetical protein AVDCRST_MAG45-678 [uncultured Solirubrobacterales bacterium]|uniref:Uncharacterized protein n=1 Tax=uncultured Solirubrobacterales bacterium TaxID=768556 RepID=A0A6J4S9Q8_9ACTN|nr:MAG: hypothetical protein AVDCRST_MAG45-678 [uncultured Solirubrobacterales bacterium]